ncbi:hypothetical protein FB45DRAFT_934776 [Roridomyces roridus]|uniref:FAD-binding PCMH-type domain-containing protein n=1 Tax=Roridomyces roridus TaxID=1738132 RepID=A0AAD7BAQ1_9AGAR|nr:hypothetical protein FB45DRAFT_934776 [Roridomyces roridus]
MSIAQSFFPSAPLSLFSSLHVSQTALDELRTAVGGRLFSSVPFAYPCFSEGPTASSCISVQSQYTNETFRAGEFSALINTQWETCQTTGAQCLLDASDPFNSAATKPPHRCERGSVPEYYIDVRDADDVAAAFKFSENTRVPLVIKNTGHDYKGRSSAPGSLALWMHHLKDMTYRPDFVPQGCTSAKSAVTLGAGVQWAEAYKFADAHNVTVVGGSDRTVGAVGGWLQGGGHGVLSNTMGMGVDRVLEYKVVTPDGKLRIANECQNEDLFFALRGGGGGTFGVVLEASILASEAVTLQAAIVSWSSPNRTLTEGMWTVMTDNALAWAADGWGGFSTSQLAILVNPVLGKDEAAKSVAPLLDFGRNVPGASVQVMTFPTFFSFFETFTSENVAVVGTNLALASRLIQKPNFQTAEERSKLVDALLKTDAAEPGNMIILLTAPTSYNASHGHGRTSVTEAWRSSLYHVTTVKTWAWNATREEKVKAYRSVSEAIGYLREITPGGAAYLNEADVYEPDHQESFWGANYEELLRIKRKYDPLQLLDCWHCVGWDRESPRFSCYL